MVFVYEKYCKNIYRIIVTSNQNLNNMLMYFCRKTIEDNFLREEKF